MLEYGSVQFPPIANLERERRPRTGRPGPSLAALRPATRSTDKGDADRVRRSPPASGRPRVEPLTSWRCSTVRNTACFSAKSFAGELRDQRSTAGLNPQPLEHQRRSDASDCDLDRRIIAGRAQHHRFGGKARARAHQSFQLTACLQLVEPPERGDHPLAQWSLSRRLSTLCR